jgi:hypothetical protein
MVGMSQKQYAWADSVLLTTVMLILPRRRQTGPGTAQKKTKKPYTPYYALLASLRGLFAQLY